jgi:proteasome lid subunit RPN8/RPN11
MKGRKTHYSGVPEKLTLSPVVFEQIKDTIGSMCAEQGGILGGLRKPGKVEVTHFAFDETASDRSGVAYTPNNAFLNQVIKQEWRPQGIEYVGSIHSHPGSSNRPSFGDEQYAKRILDVLELPYLLVPIVTTVTDTGKFQLHPYAAVQNGKSVKIIEQKLCIDGRIMAKETHATIPVSAPISWEIWVAIAGAGLLTAGLATTQLIKTLRYYRRLAEGELKQ